MMNMCKEKSKLASFVEQELGRETDIMLDPTSSQLLVIFSVRFWISGKFNFLQSNSASMLFASNAPFCCRTCKKLPEKRQKQGDNLASGENDIRNRGKLGSSVGSLSFVEYISSVGEPLASSPMLSAHKKNKPYLRPITDYGSTYHLYFFTKHNPLASETGRPSKTDEPPELGVKICGEDLPPEPTKKWYERVQALKLISD
ncbi:hypothetical protein ACROYT_G015278 [Oculina patagonica]